jgi:hypothetical protein
MLEIILKVETPLQQLVVNKYWKEQCPIKKLDKLEDVKEVIFSRLFGRMGQVIVFTIEFIYNLLHMLDFLI